VTYRQRKEVIGKQFFFEKKNQKTFVYFEYAPLGPVASTNRARVFLFLFFKKEILPCFTEK